MERGETKPRELVLNYCTSSDAQRYNLAQGPLSSKVRVYGPTKESLRDSKDFIGMLMADKGKYDIKKVFSEGEDVCVFCEYRLPSTTIFMSSWHQAEDGKIASPSTVFDSGQIPPLTRGNYENAITGRYQR